MDHRVRIILADDHVLLVEGLRLLLEPEHSVIAMLYEGHSLVAAVRDLKPDLVITDFAMPGLNGPEAALQISRELPTVKIIFLSMYTDPERVRAALESGAHGYVIKSHSGHSLKQAIRTVLEGKIYVSPEITLERDANGMPASTRRLTARQREVLKLIASGCRAKEIAATLNISVKTVEFHKAALGELLGLRTTAELTRYAIERGISPTERLILQSPN